MYAMDFLMTRECTPDAVSLPWGVHGGAITPGVQ
jgi:hypothetical protein